VWVIAATTKPAGLSKGQCGIEMAAGPTAAPVREHDQREFRLYPGDRANLAFVSHTLPRNHVSSTLQYRKRSHT
jgi:hypothetical protein